MFVDFTLRRLTLWVWLRVICMIEALLQCVDALVCLATLGFVDVSLRGWFVDLVFDARFDAQAELDYLYDQERGDGC